MAGGRFQVVITSISRRNEPSYFRFEANATAGRIWGDAIGDVLTGSTSRGLPPGIISGELLEDRGHLLVKLAVEGSPEPVRALASASNPPCRPDRIQTDRSPSRAGD